MSTPQQARRLRPRLRDKALLLVLLALALGALARPAQAQTAGQIWYVATSGRDANDCRTTQTPCRHIQSAIARAGTGDTVSLAEGTYYENIIIKKSLTLKGQRPRQTIIDGGRAGTVVTALPDGIEPATAITISHVTITNGHAPNLRGGGISMTSPSYDAIYLTVTLHKAIVSHNRTGTTESSYGGGGIYNQYGALIVDESIITNNTVVGDGAGGGILIDDFSVVTITNSLIANNHVLYSNPRPDHFAKGAGGGILIGLSYQPAVIRNTTFAHNTARTGGALSSGAESLIMTNTTVRGNSAPSILLPAKLPGTQLIVSNSILIGSPACGGIKPISSGHNLENGDSCGLRATGDKFNRPAELRPLANYGGFTPTFALKATSPAVDAGSCVSATDQRGVARPQGAACDIGAFERKGS